MTALRWLKKNNPHYCNVKIDENWIKKFESDAMFPHISEGNEEEDSKKQNNFNNGKNDAVGEAVETNERIQKNGGRSQNTVPIASTQVAIKGIVQYSMEERQ